MVSKTLTSFYTVLFISTCVWEVSCRLSFTDVNSLIKAPVFNVKDYGAKGDGNTLDTAAIKKAIQACANAKGGTVLFPTGSYLTGSFNLTSNMVLFVDKTATILGSNNPADYALVPALVSYPLSTRDNSNPRYSALISAHNQTNVTLTGGGLIDGQGWKWWFWFDTKELNMTRPPLVQFKYTNNILIDTLSLRYSAYWTVHPYTCNHVTVRNVDIFNPIGAPNTDGIDPDSCTDVVIENCVLETGDDQISLKSGSQAEGVAYNIPTVNVRISNNTIKYGYGIAIGSEMSGGIRDVIVENCWVTAAENVARVKACFAGTMQNITFRNFQFGVVEIPAYVNAFYECPAVNPGPLLKDINFINWSGDAIYAGEFQCSQGNPCNVNMQDINIESIYGFTCSNVTGKITNVYPKSCY